MYFKKLKYHLKEKLPLIVGVGLIISIHWTWLKLQEVPALVSEAEKKKEFPLFAAIRLFANKALNNDQGDSSLNSKLKDVQKAQ